MSERRIEAELIVVALHQRLDRAEDRQAQRARQQPQRPLGTIDQLKGDRNVHIEFDFSANNGRGKGTAAIFLGGSSNPKCKITDMSIAGNVCACLAGGPPSPIVKK